MMEPSSPRQKFRGFTLLEMLASFAIMAILLLIVTAMINRTSSIWTYTRGKIDQFREARDAFDLLTRKMSEATLNTYLDYEDSNGQTRTTSNSTSFVPKSYARQSDLRFLCGPGVFGQSHAAFFQMPLGVTSSGSNSGTGMALNSIGFYIDYGDDSQFLPSFIKPHTRFRLMEFIEPAESLSIYQYTTGSASAADRTSWNWFTNALQKPSPPVQIAAENIIALILLPKLSALDEASGHYSPDALAPTYLYDSTSRQADPNLNPRNQLPPVVQVTMIAIDEASAARLGENGLQSIRSELADRFKTASEYEKDMTEVTSFLTSLKVSYQIFTTNISLKNAKWSHEQKG